MTKFKAQGLNNTFKNARKGFRLVLKSELNIRIHVTIAFLVIFCRTILLAKTVKACIIKLLYSNKVHYQIDLVH